MIEIIREEVKMPDFFERRFMKEKRKNRWVVVDTNSDSIVYKAKFEDCCFACYHLNKKYYRDLAAEKTKEPHQIV